MMNSVTCFKIDFVETFPQLASREAGEKARILLKKHLMSHDKLIFDLGNKSLTPSFVDSSLAVLAQEVGFDIFKQKVKFDNTNDTTKILIKKTFTQRSKEI